MKTNMIMFIAYIYSSILRKRKHCLDYGILKERVLTDIDVQSEEVLAGQPSTNDPSKEFIDLEQLEAKRNKISKQQAISMIEKKFVCNGKELNEEENLTKIKKVFQICDNKIQIGPLKNTKDYFTRINMDFLFSYIKKFISLNLTDFQHDFYKTKLANIKKIYRFSKIRKQKFKNYQSIFVPYDDKIFAIIQNICSKHDSEMPFVAESYGMFIKKLISGISDDEDLCKLMAQVRGFSNDTKKIIFYSEFFNCSKHFAIAPELMSLGSVFNEKSIEIITIFIRFVNLYLAKNNNAKDIRFFILCMI